MKRVLYLFFIQLLVISILLPSNAFATDKTTIDEKYCKTLKEINGELITLQVTDSQNNELANGEVIVYSNLENKVIAHTNLDTKGKTTIYYEEPYDLIQKGLESNEFLDVHYIIIIAKEEEFITQGYTRTYYRNSKSKNTIDNIKTKKVSEVFKISTKNARIDKHVKVEKMGSSNIMNSAETTSLYSDPYVTETVDLGNKKIRFATISTTTGCDIEANLKNGTETTISGTGIATFTFTKGSNIAVGSGLIENTSPRIYSFYTYYHFLDKHYVIDAGGYHYDFWQAEADNWVGGINYSSSYSSANDKTYNEIQNDNPVPYSPGSYVAYEYGDSFEFGAGWAGSFTGPLSGNDYEVGISVTTSSSKELFRQHGSSSYYYEYGDGEILLEKPVIKG